MAYLLRTTLLGIPILVWVAQLLYVAISLIVLVALIYSLNKGSVSLAGTRLFTIIYIIVMVVADVIWRLAIRNEHFLIVVITIIAAFIINIAVAQVFIVQSAHSSFDNYYKFRGCSELISRSDDSATCKLPSGETIKIVKYQNKWYLDGDLPNGWF